MIHAMLSWLGFCPLAVDIRLWNGAPDTHIV